MKTPPVELPALSCEVVATSKAPLEMTKGVSVSRKLKHDPVPLNVPDILVAVIDEIVTEPVASVQMN